MKAWKLATMLLVCSITIAAQSSIANKDAERSKLIALENAWNQAQIHHDGAALERLVGDTFIYTNWDGTLMNRAQFITDAKDTSTEVKSASNTDVNIYFYPGVAVVTGAYHTISSTKGKVSDHHGRFTDTWILSGSQWVCVASHTNLMKK